MRKALLGLAIVVLCASAARAGDDVVAARFESFCADWMKKLEARERDNRAAIKWKAGADGVEGEYVGYSHEHRCQLKPALGPGSTPIGKIIYTELVYRQAGKSTAEAMKVDPRAVDATEVTEIFRYSGGKWVY
jgi:hypothetical protein